MINYIKRKDLKVEKYDACIENSIQSNIFAFSWYLDIVADNWDILVLNNYEAVMPIPWKKKYGIKYVYPPFWLLELGVFSKENSIEIDDFLKVLYTKFKLIELRMNTSNIFSNYNESFLKKQLQYVSLKDDYTVIFNNYNRNRRRELTNAKKNNLIENWNDNPEKLITLFKENIGNRIKSIKSKEYTNLLKLMNLCLEKKAGELLTISDTNNNLLASAFFLKHKNKVTQLVCVSDVKNRKNGAHTFFNDRAIFKYQSHFDIYNFGGSSMESIANYYKSFGAETEEYQHIKYNNLPSLLKLFKR